MNINQRGFVDLLKPLKHYQTAPPLFLWLMKCIYLIPIGATWFKYKLFFFLLNIPFIYLIYDLVKRFSKDPIVQIVALAMVCLNPFFIYHSLTFKQYIIDTIVILLLVKSELKADAKWGYKGMWVVAPLLCNPVLFVYTGFLLHAFWNLFKIAKKESNVNFGTSIIQSVNAFFRIPHYRWFLFPLLSYVAYFLWYRQQEGFLSLTRFMWDFWSQTFFSNPHDFFIRIYYFFIGNITFVFSHDKTLANLGTLLFFIGLIRFYKYNTDKRLRQQLGLYMLALGVFVTLNFLKMYPIEPRLLLFFSPVMVLLIALSGEIKHTVYRVCWLLLVVIGLGNYALYFPFKVYDVRMMTKRLETIKPKAVFYSLNSVRAIRRFDAFTEGAFDIESKYVYGVDYKGLKDSLFVLQLVHQFGRLGENGPVMEACIKNALQDQRINLHSVADGFNFYRINDPKIISEFVREGVLHPDYARGTELSKQPNFFEIH